MGEPPAPYPSPKNASHFSTLPQGEGRRWFLTLGKAAIRLCFSLRHREHDMTYEHITAGMDGPILTLTLNRPDKLNAYTAQMGAELEHAFRRADEDDAVRVIIVTGAGRGFCAGADISGGANAFDTKSGNTAMFSGSRPRASRGAGFVEAIFNCRKPSIAAINGPAV